MNTSYTSHEDTFDQGAGWVMRQPPSFRLGLGLLIAAIVSVFASLCLVAALGPWRGNWNDWSGHLTAVVILAGVNLLGVRLRRELVVGLAAALIASVLIIAVYFLSRWSNPLWLLWPVFLFGTLTPIVNGALMLAWRRRFMERSNRSGE